MTDRSLLFLLIVLMVVCLYRMLQSVLLLNKKINIIDEQFYIVFFYLSTVGAVVFFSDLIILGIILVACLPIILTIYLIFVPTRKYWIINGYELSESYFVNYMIEHDSHLADNDYRKSHVMLSKKKDEKKIKIDFKNIKYDEKEKILKIIKESLKQENVKVNKKEIWVLCLLGLALLVLIFTTLIVLFV